MGNGPMGPPQQLMQQDMNFYPSQWGPNYDQWGQQQQDYNPPINVGGTGQSAWDFVQPSWGNTSRRGYRAAKNNVQQEHQYNGYSNQNGYTSYYGSSAWNYWDDWDEDSYADAEA